MTERINELIASSYDMACRHGFHDVETSIEHQMMLVIGELGEAVEADRKNRRANRAGFEKRVVLTWYDRFRDYVKDTVEDELADVCIRLFDLCGCFQIDVLQPNETMCDEWRKLFDGYSFTECAYVIVQLLSGCRTNSSMAELSTNIGSALYFIEYWSKKLCIDLDWHIDMRQRYNDGRERLHGKKY